MDEDFHVSQSLAEKRRRYFAERDKKIAEKKGFRRIEVDDGPRGPQFLMVLLCVLGIALVGFKAFGPNLFRADTSDVFDAYSGSAGNSEASGARLDPQPMQSDLIRLETALFDPDQVDSLDLVVVNLQFEIERLLSRLSGADPRQTAAARSLERLADGLPESPDLETLERFKSDWLRYRGEHFQHASWFRTPSAGNRPTGLTYAAYREASSDLLRLAGRILTDTEAVLSERSALGTVADQEETLARMTSDWNSTTQSWREELRTIRATVPSQPDRPPSNEALAAIQQLDSAFRACEGALPSGLPSDSDIQTIEAALLRAQFATEAFDRLN